MTCGRGLGRKKRNVVLVEESNRNVVVVVKRENNRNVVVVVVERGNNYNLGAVLEGKQ